MAEPRVHSIPPGRAFLPTLAEALAGGRLVPGFPERAGPTALAGATIYVPTRRAARALAAEFATRAGGEAAILPRIVPLGDPEGAELALAADALEEGEAAAALAAPVAPLERRLLLARLVQAWSRALDPGLSRRDPDRPFLVPSSPADAVALAGDLEALMDDFALEDAPWERMAEAVEAEFSRYFALTLDFVRIAFERWPAILAERGASDPTRRRGALIDAQAERLARDPPPGPVIAAGSTGSIRATARLLAAIARLPKGAVVLPGLDRDLDEESFALVAGDPASGRAPLSNHPQVAMARLLAGPLGAARAAVGTLGEPEDPGLRAREAVLSEAMRPAETTDAWARMDPARRAGLVDAAAAGLALVEAADEREEALAIALALRETLAEPGRTAALITPDRGLAARVCAELARWDVRIDDSAGVALADAPAGRLARLAAEAAAAGFAPLETLALLQHPDARLGLSAEAVERARAALEIGVLRGPEPRSGIAGLRAALALRRDETARERAPRPRKRLAAADWDLADALLARLEEAFAGFGPDPAADEVALPALAARHRAAVEALAARPPEETGPDEEDDDGSLEALGALFDELAAVDADAAVRGSFRDYPGFFAALARERRAPGRAGAAHPRLKILGLLEARLLRVDRAVLGGLDEGIWPPRAETDAFLNRPLREELGLAPPERRIGQTAHDFVQCLCAPQATITRALKRGGAPTVPSRFLQRLRAFMGEAPVAAAAARGARLLALARRLDAAAPAPPLRRPAPKPGPDLFPARLSVTEIETLVRDPYAVFARRVLGLDKLEGLAEAPGAADRGTLVHETFRRFVERFPGALPPRAEAQDALDEIARELFDPIERAYPDVAAEWRPRFARLAAAFLDWERDRRALLAEIAVERAGTLPLRFGERTVTLSVRADRIERRRDGTAVVVDFKTGAPPTPKTVFAGFSPQLTLEAAMLQEGAFPGLPPPAGTPELLYVHASGGKEPFVERPILPPKDEERSVADLVAEHRARAQGLIARFLSGEYGFVSRPYPQYAQRYSDYDHLARVKEWSAAGGAEDGGESA